MKLRLLLSLAITALLLLSQLAAGKTSERVEALLRNMTLSDKIGQMTQIGVHKNKKFFLSSIFPSMLLIFFFFFHDLLWSSLFLEYSPPPLLLSSFFFLPEYIVVPGTKNRVNRLIMRELAEKSIGSYLQAPSSVGGFNLNVSEWIEMITEIQDITLSAGAKIPMLYGIDSVHGSVFVHGATIFPQQIGAGASFNRELVTQMGAITAKDSKLVGLPWVFSPILDLATEPRWARVYETFGEDPYVVAELGKAIIQGIQGNPINLADPTKAAACMKHFIGYGEPRTGKDRNPNWIPDRFLYEYFVPPFQAAVDIGVATTMESYNDINGEPVCASEKYLKKLLREEMGFKGTLVTDWAEIRDLSRFHKVAEDEKDAVRISMERTTIDMSMVAIGPTFYYQLLDLVNEGIIPESRIDESAARILQLKEDLGLFDRPYPDPQDPLLATIGSDADRAVSLELARESVTLLENRNNILPLAPSKLSKVLVAGPSGNSLTNQCGGWTVNWQGAVSDEYFAFGTTILKGVQNIVSGGQVVYKRGCSIDGEFERNELEETVAEASTADVIILALGEDHYAERLGDIDDLTLPAGQLQLANALFDTGVPVILVLVEGRPRILNGIEERAAAVLDAYLPALEGGQAIAEIIFGLVNPSGKLPLSYPKTTGSAPLQYYHKVTEEPNFLWEFGHGLSYSTITYSNLALSSSTTSPYETLAVSVDITNSGPFAAKETVLLFVSDLVREITPEVKRLRKFEKISLGVNETKKVTFQLTGEDYSFIDLNIQRSFGYGEFSLAVGPLSASFQVNKV